MGKIDGGENFKRNFDASSSTDRRTVCNRSFLKNMKDVNQIAS